MPIGKSHDDKFGHSNPNATSEIINFTLWDSLGKVRYEIATWKDKMARDAGEDPVETIEVYATGTDFNTYFAKSALTGGGKNPIRNAENHALQSLRFSGGIQT